MRSQERICCRNVKLVLNAELSHGLDEWQIVAQPQPIRVVVRVGNRRGIRMCHCAAALNVEIFANILVMRSKL